MLYRHTSRYLTSPDLAPITWCESIPDTLVFFRYVQERFSEPIRRYSYWTELETSWADYAGLAVGIGDGDCRYRIEWHCPISIALKDIIVGNRRMSGAGVFTEYMVKIEVPQSAVIWHEMNDWGRFGN